MDTARQGNTSLLSPRWTLTTLAALLSLAILRLPTNTNALSPTSLQRFYGLVGPVLDLMSIVEDKPRNRALELADLSSQDCQSVLEVGPGTGRTAKQILSAHPNIQRYTAMELTPRMADLAVDKVGRKDGVTVLPGDCLEQDWGSNQYDRIVAFYVLDIFDRAQIESFLQKSQQALSSENGKLVLVSITNPEESASFLAKLVMGSWKAISNAVPVLLGGCRPIQLASHLSKDSWNVEYCEKMSVLGYTSEIVIASPKR